MRRRSFLTTLAGLAIPRRLRPTATLAPPPDLNFRFVEITEASGVHFKHVAAPEKRYIVESMSGGVALFDYDNDGYLDIYFTNSLTVDAASNSWSARSALYHNNGDGTFTDVTDRSRLAYPGWAMGVAAGDYDGDGFLDLYVTCLGPNRLYHNNGDGTFTDVTGKAGVDDPRWSTGAAFGDYDHDGYLDLFVANYIDFRLTDLPEFGKGKFCQFRGVPVQCGPRGLPGAGDALFHNNGDGTFTDVTQRAGVSDPEGRYGLGVLWSDLDGDGWVDLFVANDAGPNFLYKNNRNGTFTEIGYPAGIAVGEDGNEQGSMGVAIADFNHDGLLDIFVTNFDDEYNALYRHDSPMTFTDVSYASKLAQVSIPYVGWGTDFADFDNDGWLDLMVVNGHVYPQMDQVKTGIGYAQRKLLHRNNRDGTFSEIAAEAGEALMLKQVSRGAAFGDIDNDGDVDVVINNLDGAPMILRNDGASQNHWITVKTVGSKPNTQGLGARVRVVAGDLVQINEVRSGGSYLSQNDVRLHFGLDKRTRVDRIEVRWPTGLVDRAESIAANQCVVIQEGKGLVRRYPPGTAWK